ncbi:unnamed protein product [Brassica napus]|uniref:(rape) hypothetical protein n=1 Tax=Brassica napus TaxID=3708 RepID=A0A816N9T7_BRANA|nr:unnamed protein product [Brassica napus]
MSRSVILAFLSALAVMAVVSGTVEDTIRRVVDALADASFEEWSATFIETNDKIRGDVLGSTLFIPDISANLSGREDRHKVAAYHIVTERLDYFDLLSKPNQTRLPTLLKDYVNGVLVTETEVFADRYIAIHRIASPLDFKTYGRTDSKPSGHP